jgi:hypothetical protein
LRRCAINRNIADLNPDLDTELFSLPNLYSFTMPLEFTQSLTEMSTKDISVAKTELARKFGNLHAKILCSLNLTLYPNIGDV